MKKTFIFSLITWSVFFLFSSAMIAQNLGDQAKNVDQPEQNKPDNKINLSFVAGPQFTDVSNMGSANTSGKVGLLLGILGEYNLFKSIKISSGIIFDRRGFGLELYNPYVAFPDTFSYKSHSEIDMTYNVDFLTFPLNVKYEVGEEQFKFFIQGTFYYSFYLSSYRKGFTNLYIHPDDFQYIDPEQDPDIQPGDNRTNYNERTDLFLGDEKFSNFDFGLVFYLGAQYDLTDKLSVHFAPGFTSSFGSLLDNPMYKTTKWVKNFKIETGITYKLK